MRRQQRRTRILIALVAAVMAAAVALGGVVYTLVQSRQAQVAQQAAETELLTAPDVQTYSATMKDGGQISFVVSRSLDRAMFIGKDLPTVGADRTLSAVDPRGRAPHPGQPGGRWGRSSAVLPRESQWSHGPGGQCGSSRRSAAANAVNHPDGHRTVQLTGRACRWGMGGLPCA